MEMEMVVRNGDGGETESEHGTHGHQIKAQLQRRFGHGLNGLAVGRSGQKSVSGVAGRKSQDARTLDMAMSLA